MFNYDYVKIHINMPIKILQTFSGSYHFIKIKQNKTINVCFQRPSSICESKFKAYSLPYTGRPQRLLGFVKGSILSSLHSMLPRYKEHIQELSCIFCTCVLENWN